MCISSSTSAPSWSIVLSSNIELINEFALSNALIWKYLLDGTYCNVPEVNCSCAAVEAGDFDIRFLEEIAEVFGLLCYD
jgi:hypothetical protein